MSRTSPAFPSPSLRPELHVSPRHGFSATREGYQSRATCTHAWRSVCGRCVRLLGALSGPSGTSRFVRCLSTRSLRTRCRRRRPRRPACRRGEVRRSHCVLLLDGRSEAAPRGWSELPVCAVCCRWRSGTSQTELVRRRCASCAAAPLPPSDCPACHRGSAHGQSGRRRGRDRRRGGRCRSGFS